MGVKFTSHMNKYLNDEDRRQDAAMLRLITDVDRTAKILAPKLTRALVKSGRISRKGPGHYTDTFGSPTVPYARRRHFENKKNPQTLRYLERAGDAAVQNPDKYFGKAT